MLAMAYKYEIRLRELLVDTWYDEKYKYYNMNGNNELFAIDHTDNGVRHFVSLNGDGEVIGLIDYGVNMVNEHACGIAAISFTDDIVTFGRDLLQVVDDIFEKFNFRKLNFNVVIGNPAERAYDRLVCKCGGRIVGIYERDVRLYDGLYYDNKAYEIMRENYLNSKVK